MVFATRDLKYWILGTSGLYDFDIDEDPILNQREETRLGDDLCTRGAARLPSGIGSAGTLVSNHQEYKVQPFPYGLNKEAKPRKFKVLPLA